MKSHVQYLFIQRPSLSVYQRGLGTKKGYKLQNHFYEGKETPKQNVSKMAFLEVLNQRTINNFLLCILVFFEFGKATAIIPYSQKTFFYLQEFFHIRHLLQLEPFPVMQDFKFVAFAPKEGSKVVNQMHYFSCRTKKVEFKRIIGAFLV